jgi:hypothetical protein
LPKSHGVQPAILNRCDGELLRAFRSVLQRMRVRWSYRMRRRSISIISGPWRSVIGARPAAAAGAHGNTYAGAECAGIFFVEDIECRQANVRDLLLTQSNFVAHTRVPRQHIRCRSAGCRGCTACQRQRQPGGPQNRYDFAPALSLRTSFSRTLLLLGMLRSPASPTTRQPPEPARLCSCAFASNLAFRAT